MNIIFNNIMSTYNRLDRVDRLLSDYIVKLFLIFQTNSISTGSF